MIPDIKELNFPKIDGKQYATLTHASIQLADMGEKTITTQVRIDGDIVPDFSQDWEVEFQGEKYIMPLRIPQGAKDNTSLNSTIDLTFQHWAVYQLKRYPFVTMQPIETGTAIADEEVASVQLNLGDFCTLFGQVLKYYYDDAITINLNPTWQYQSEPTLIEISHTLVWNVLIDAFHDKYGVRWAIEAAEENDNINKGGERYVIKVGYPTTEVEHIFEYGFNGGLMTTERQIQSEDIRNMLKGRGGDTNIPFRYFKNIDPNNPDFRADPDWVEELANIYFTNLMPATFRSYVQGWKAAHISQYPGYTAVGESNAYAPWAYRKGYTDTKFHPVEFVADEITISQQEGDKQVEILPGYSPYVKKDSSLDKYGPLLGTLDNNEDIYPSIQGSGMDIAVDVEQIESDDIEEAAESDAQERNVGTAELTMPVAANLRKSGILTGKGIYVPEGQYGDFDPGTLTIKATTKNKKQQEEKEEDSVIQIEDISISVYDNITNEEHSASGIPAGSYYYKIYVSLYNTLDKEVSVTISCESPQIKTATIDDQWKNTFDIWVKNIWESTKLPTETDSQYAERVWTPILGDREGNEAAVMFTTGALAISEDYEFKIPKGMWPVYDTSKNFTDNEGVVHTSHWRLTLAKSDADIESTGLYVPSTKRQGKAGDKFILIGTEMTHHYVEWAEKALDDWKKDSLEEVKDIKPAWVITTDRVRLNNEGKPDALINQLRVGNSIRLADKRFIQPMSDMAYETLYLQSITYTYREPSSDDAALNPDVEIVLGNEYTTSANPVSMMQGEINALQRQVGSISNIEQIVRAVCDKLYLRKDGISDRSLSPTQFFSLLTSGDFRAGLVGGAGWGAYKDENNNWVLEADRINARQEMQVNSLVINQVTGRGGMIVESAAQMSVTRVIETDSSYICYFDQKDGSVANLFHIDDVAYCQQWTPENGELKFYKRRVIAVDVNSITLTKERNDSDRPANWPDNGVNGNGIPTEDDNIIHFGNYNDSTRQYVKVRDVIGGGYERYIESLDSVTATGAEYYFVGKQDGQNPRWFIGHKDADYAEWKDGVLHIKGTLSLQSNVGDITLADLVGLEYLQKALPQSTDIVGGLVLTSLIRLGLTDDSGNRVTHSGISGLYDPQKIGGGISSWWGGEMLDKFDYYTYADNIFTPIPDKDIPDNIAAGIVRFDGTGYFANGNFWWDNQGIIRMNPKTLFLNLDIDGLDSGSLEQNLKKIYAEIIKLTSLFEFDESEKYIKAKHGVVFPYGAAFYEGEPGGGGGTGSGLIQKVYDYSALSGSFDNSTLTDTFNAYTIAQLAARLSTQENAGYVTSAVLASALASKADKATTLAGYGITDAPTKAGAGATGTWGISITGNAATATAAQSVINSGSGAILTFNTNVENTSDTWLLVQAGTEIQHRNMATLSVASALNSDTLDGLHAAAFGRRYVLGTTVDAQVSYVLLGKAYTSGAAIVGFAVTGTLFFNRGGGVLEHDRVDIAASAQYLGNMARFASMGSQANAYRTVLVTYQGERWIAVERNIVQAVDVTYEGVAMNGVDFHLVTAAQVSDVTAFGNNNIYANATSATNANNSDTLDGYHAGNASGNIPISNGTLCTDLYASRAQYVANLGNLTAVSGTTAAPSGLRLYAVYNNGYPCTYGNLLRIGGLGAGELLCEWTGDSPATLGHLYYRSKRDTTSVEWSSWGKLAFTTDNVASATKLQTARSIWGQSFNGDGDVSGSLSGVGDIAFAAASTYNVGSKAARALYVYASEVNGGTGGLWLGGGDGGSISFYTGDAGKGVANLGRWNAAGLGVGTSNPAYPLDVAGIARAASFLTTTSGVVGSNGYRCQGGGIDATFGINPDTGGPYIWVSSAHALRFATGNAERMRITSDGLVGIGTTAPEAALHIVGAAAHVHLDSADNYPYFTCYSNQVAKATFGANPVYGAYLKNNTGNHRIFVLDDCTVGVLKSDSTIAYRIAVDSNNNITITPAGGQITLNANVRINGKTTFVNG